MLHKLGVVGAEGRMGQTICRLAQELNAGVVLYGCRQSWEIESRPEVIIDVSHRVALPKVIDYCRSEDIPLVEGTSGLLPEDQENIRKLSELIPVVQAPNFSFGHFLQKVLVTEMAKSVQRNLGSCKCSVIDRHPTYKKDSPSATAKKLANLWLEQTKVDVANITAIRAGLPVSEHQITWTFPGELLSLQHSVAERTALARGAIKAALWVKKQSPGLWNMSDVYLAEIGNYGTNN